MPARLPTQRKTPFLIDPRPLDECSTSMAGLFIFSRMLRSLQLPSLAEANLPLKERQRGQTVAEYIESVILLQLAGGSCPEDLARFRVEKALQRGLGFAFPTPGAVRKFLNRFDDLELTGQRPPRTQQRSYIVPCSEAIRGLQRVQQGLVRQIARRYEAQRCLQSVATIDADATIIESHKRSAFSHYEGGRGYQPMVAVWVEPNLIVADQWRDGNVPARQEPVDCVQWAFQSLPVSIRKRFFRGDSACHEAGLLKWLTDPKRAAEPGGAIGFAVSAFTSPELQHSLRSVKEPQWITWATEPDGTLRQWAEVPFVPGERGEHKRSTPLRYVGLRLLKTGENRFADGSDRHSHAVITNLDYRGDKLLDWHREKAGTIEHVHDAVKNHLAGGHVPSQKFGADAAWFKVSLMAYNLASALTGLACNDDERLQHAEIKRLRFHLVNVAGRFSRSQCTMRLRFLANQETIDRILKVWEIFQLPTQATAFK